MTVDLDRSKLFSVRSCAAASRDARLLHCEPYACRPYSPLLWVSNLVAVIHNLSEDLLRI
jgi:hypothetical protein